jgi:hypothetical protein
MHAGFFIVEEKIMQSTQQLVSPERMSTLWAAAVSSIRACMDGGFMETDNTASMLVMKDYVFLTVSALSKHRFDCSPITVRPAPSDRSPQTVSFVRCVSSKIPPKCVAQHP